MALSNYSDLKTAVATWLARSDLTAAIPDFITLAEASFKREPRLVNVASASLTVSAATRALPADFKALVSLYGDTDALRGPIETGPPEKLVEVKARYGTTGAPMFACVIDNDLHFAPAPDATYTLLLKYEATITALSATQATNWLLTAHPDIYLYGALVASAPFLKEDARVATWAAQLEKAIAEVRIASDRKRFGGRMVIRPRQTIG